MSAAMVPRSRRDDCELGHPPLPCGAVPRVRLDSLLAERGLFPSRSRAAAAVIAGQVHVGPGRARADKPGQLVTAREAVVIAVAPLVWIGVFYTFDLYAPQHLSAPEELRRVIGLKSAAVREVLPRATDEAVHRDYFVLV